MAREGRSGLSHAAEQQLTRSHRPRNAKAKKVVEYITAERSKEETVKNISEEEDEEESNIDDAFDVVGWKKGPTELGLLAALTASSS